MPSGGGHRLRCWGWNIPRMGRCLQTHRQLSSLAGHGARLQSWVLRLLPALRPCGEDAGCPTAMRAEPEPEVQGAASAGLQRLPSCTLWGAWGGPQDHHTSVARYKFEGPEGLCQV